MKRISIMCAAALVAGGAYSPAQAVSVNDQGYFKRCMAAYVQDPATYDRDCEKSMDSLSKGTIEPAPVVVCVGGIELRLPMQVGARVRVAEPYDPCHPPT